MYSKTAIHCTVSSTSIPSIPLRVSHLNGQQRICNFYNAVNVQCAEVIVYHQVIRLLLNRKYDKTISSYSYCVTSQLVYSYKISLYITRPPFRGWRSHCETNFLMIKLKKGPTFFIILQLFYRTGKLCAWHAYDNWQRNVRQPFELHDCVDSAWRSKPKDIRYLYAS